MSMLSNDHSSAFRRQWIIEIAAGLGLAVFLAAVLFWDRNSPEQLAPSVTLPQQAMLAVEQPPPLPEIPEPPLVMPPKLPDPPLPVISQGAEAPPEPPQLPPDELLDAKKKILIGLTTRPSKKDFSGVIIFGITTAAAKVADQKRLTFDACGNTHNTIVMVDSVQKEFGGDFGVYLNGVPESKETISATKSDKDLGNTTITVGKLESDGPYSSDWQLNQIVFNQTLKYVRGAASKKLDKAEISFSMHNQDRVPHRLGVRILIDTFIGNNDGVPFYVPGRQGVVTSHLDIRDKEIPEFILALEKNTLEDQDMTVVEFGFADRLEDRPSRLVLTRWPKELAPVSSTRLYRGSQIPWEIKPYKIVSKVPFENDSAVFVYFDPVMVQPGDTRSVRFTYGLGSLSTQGKSLASLAFRELGSVQSGSTFWLTAMIKNPTANQTVTLTLPDGMQLVDGDLTQKVSVDRSDLAYVNWKIKAAEKTDGTREIAARLDPLGIEEKMKCVIKSAEPQIKELAIGGEPVVGGLIRVTAQILNGQPDTKATLELPPQCTLEPGHQAEIHSSLKSQASWVVRINEGKEHNFHVKLNNGRSAGKMVVATTRPAEFKNLEVAGNLKSGGAVRVSAIVALPSPGMHVKLELPAGATLKDGEVLQKPVTAQAVPSWVVIIDPEKSGPVKFKAALSNGLRAEKHVTIEPVTPQLRFHPNPDKLVAGKSFWIVVLVNPALKNTSLELTLPDSLKLTPSHSARKPVEIKGSQGMVAWLVITEGRNAGDAQVQVKLIHDHFSNVQATQSLKIERGNLVE